MAELAMDTRGAKPAPDAMTPAMEFLGDQAVLLRWGDQAEVAVNRQVHAVAAALRTEMAPWLADCVPAYASLALYFDAAAITHERVAQWIADWLATRYDFVAAAASTTLARLVEIPVCYGGACGPDLDDVAQACGLSAAEVVERHVRCEYTVAMLGFSPGFPYLLGLDPQLAVARLATPRVRVPAGSVGIGGNQSGIYPGNGPGGWRLLGRTPQVLFNATQESPALLLPGDRVRFVPIAAARFEALIAARDQ